MDGLRAEMRWERAGIRRVSRDSTGAVRMPIWNTTIMCLAFFWGLCRALCGVSALRPLVSLEEEDQPEPRAQIRIQ